MVTLNYSITAWISHFLACIGGLSVDLITNRNHGLFIDSWVLSDPSFCNYKSRSSGCFGCCTKPAPVIAVDEPTKGLRIQGRSVKKTTVSDDFWSSSTCDLDNSTVVSQRSISSISTSNQSINLIGGSSSNNLEFANPGLVLWNQSRLQWAGGCRSRSQTKLTRDRQLSSWNTTYESLLTSKNRFRHPIPLSEMVEFLVDVWEHEGLYD